MTLGAKPRRWGANPRPRQGQWAGLWGAIALAGAAPAAAGQTSPTVIDQPRPFVVSVAAIEKAVAALDAVVRDAVSGQPVVLSTVAVAHIDPSTLVRGPAADRRSPPLGRAYIDLTDPHRATVYVIDGVWDRILVRSVPFTANPDVVQETVGRIVSTAVEALLAGSFARDSQTVADFQRTIHAAPPAITRAPPAAAPPAAGRAAEIAAGYEATLYGSAHPLVHGPTLDVRVVLGDGRWRPSLKLEALYRLPVEDQGTLVAYRLSTVALRLMGGVQRPLSPRWTLVLDAGLGLDFVRLEPRQNDNQPTTFVTADRWFTVGLGRIAAGARWKASSWLSLAALVVLDLDFSHTRLLVTDDQSTSEMLALYSVRPGLSLAAAVP